MHADVTDLDQQIVAACDMGGWPLELRQCFGAANSVDTLKGCVGAAHE